MRKLGLLSTSAISSAALFGVSFGLAAPAHAQEGDAQCTDEQVAAGTCDTEVELQSGQVAESEQSLVVTGSRIRRPNLTSTIPITSLGGEQIFQQGDTNVGETLNELPQLRSTFSQQNPGLGIGIAGLNLLDLRGLGTQRTLVLVNGRRHVPADILATTVSVDTNSIPSDLIERIDIVTGGNSAIYGSDAIAGVVNFILRRDFEGLQVRGQAGINEKGFGGNQYVSAMYGMDFGDGAGNVTVHGEYSHQERIFGSDLPWLRQVNGLVPVDADVTGLPGNSDDFPDRVFIRDARRVTVNTSGLIPINQPTTNPLCGRGTAANNGAPNNAGLPYNCTFIFTSDGRLTAQTGTRYGAGILGGIAGGNGDTGREGELLSVLPFLERYNFNLLGHYEFSDLFEVFAEAKWTRVNALGNNSSPSFIQGTRIQFDARERIRIDNPFLRPEDRATLAGLILASGCNTDLQVACGTGNLTAAQQAAIADGSYRFVLARTLADSGIRDEQFERETVRIVGGVRGAFWDDWGYEVSANYGRFEEDITTFGFVDRQRFMLSLDAGRNPATGQIQCRAQFDPASAIPFPNNAANQARLAADIAACVPYNPFGAPDNSAAASYFVYNATATSSIEQLVFTGFVSGDTSAFFELPGGPVSFALGAEYRREEAFYQQDPFVTDGFTNSVSIPTFAPDPFEVKEAFAELRIPILSDMPFFHELTLSGAARVADYGGGTGTVWAYNAGADWAPIRDVRFRGNYSRAVRAPNVGETGFPLVPNFAPNFIDPCGPNNIGAGTTFRSANCQADLGALLGNLQAVAISLPVLSGSNPDLTAETSDSWTIGAVVQPRFIPGLSLSVDYYDITVEGVIVSLGAQAIANSCYDQPNLDNVFCRQFTRFRGPGTGPLGEVPGAILGNSLIQAPLNFASRQRRGIDFNAAYRANLGEGLSLNTNLIYTHNLKNSNFQDPINPDFENRLLGELGDPVDEFRLDVDFSVEPFTIGYRMRYIGSMWVNAFEDFNALQDRPPQDADWADIRKFPAVTYHDLRFEWDISGDDNAVSRLIPGGGSELRFYVGVDNLFNKHPPLGLAGTGTTGIVDRGTGNAAIYDFRGRNYYAGFRARF